MPIKYNIEEDYVYQQGIEQGIEQEKKNSEAVLEQERRKSIIAMLMLGVAPKQIADYLDLPIAFIEKIQQELN